MDLINALLDVIAMLSVAGIYLAALYIPRTKSRRVLVASVLTPIVSTVLAGIISLYVKYFFR